MNHLFNKLDFLERRKKLRRDVPFCEKKLWQFLKGKQLQGIKFRRQFGIGPYVVDFFCPRHRIAIEVDGDSHYEENAEKNDRLRTSFIESKGIRIVRFTNTDIVENIDGVIETIRSELCSL